jgi:hypothetical protein
MWFLFLFQLRNAWHSDQVDLTHPVTNCGRFKHSTVLHLVFIAFFVILTFGWRGCLKIKKQEITAKTQKRKELIINLNFLCASASLR